MKITCEKEVQSWSTVLNVNSYFSPGPLVVRLGLVYRTNRATHGLVVGRSTRNFPRRCERVVRTANPSSQLQFPLKSLPNPDKGTLYAKQW
ncbi:hypothetical protein J6590_075253 [Homalodisca vitripennis]|nr:hypothetical protein J6590_075253 [Homalodisca vitripennis]